jgi:hypothetical protein
MDAIVTLLEPTYYGQVSAIMEDLKEQCGIVGGLVTPVPHFSWNIAPRYDLERLHERLAAMAAAARPFTVRAAGLALFTGERPVVYVPLVMTAALMAFHRAIWEQTIDLAEAPVPYYAPDRWIPHITLAMFDVTRENINCLMQRLAFAPIDWELRVDQIGTIVQPPGSIGTVGRLFPFGG